MKLSENWLREWTNPKWDVATLAEELSLAGLEVDDVSPVAPAFSKVVVGHVLSVEKHPDADKLNITQVDVGAEEPVQIVCGAKNVVAGMKACCAMVGAVLPGDFKIKKAKLRGVPSHGMLCGATEIGLPDDGVDGLHVLPDEAPIGMDIREYLNLDDNIIDVDLTPNRADCLSIEGMARDCAAMANISWSQPFETETVSKTGACAKSIQVFNEQACPKYLACSVTGFNTQANTPTWMKQKLERGGVTPKSLLVDITNYVMLELGQPMHAFDLDKLSGNIQVRMANEGEKLITLEEKEVVLKSDTLVIADEQGPIAIAGIMGGFASAVSEQTSQVLFECAHFSPLAITGKARAYGMHTDASHRFERGVDPMLPERALERALALLTEIAGGKISEVVSVISDENLPKPAQIQLRPERVVKLLGVAIDADEIESIFVRLGFDCVQNEAGWLITAPSYRFDMAIEADLIEEIGRIHGYNNLPEIPVEAPMRLPSISEAEQEVYSLKQALVQRGYNEVVTYSFVEQKMQQKLVPMLPEVCLQNPISDDMKAMRTTLFPGLLQTVSYNQKRQQNRVRIFEAGLVFVNLDNQLQQIPTLAGAIVGPKTPVSWDKTEDRNVDFYDLKGDVGTLLTMNHIKGEVRFEPHEYAVFHPGQSAAIIYEGKTIGVMGQLHPKHVKMMGVSGKVFLFSLRLEALTKTVIPNANKLSKYPEVKRDLAFVVNSDLSIQALFDAVRSVQSDILQNIELFDIYRGDGVGENEKSIAITLTLQHLERTLQDEEVDALMNQIIEQVASQVGGILR